MRLDLKFEAIGFANPTFDIEAIVVRHVAAGLMIAHSPDDPFRYSLGKVEDMLQGPSHFR